MVVFFHVQFFFEHGFNIVVTFVLIPGGRVRREYSVCCGIVQNSAHVFSVEVEVLREDKGNTTVLMPDQNYKVQYTSLQLSQGLP